MNILDEARQTVDQRREEYGDPVHNLTEIALVWEAFTGSGRHMSATDVCLMMILLKVMRQKGQEYHRDTVMDIAGYAYIIALLNGDEK